MRPPLRLHADDRRSPMTYTNPRQISMRSNRMTNPWYVWKLAMSRPQSQVLGDGRRGIRSFAPAPLSGDSLHSA